MDDVKVSDVELISRRLEDECPWDTVSAVLSHQGWLDLLETLQEVSPEAYGVLRRDLLK